MNSRKVLYRFASGKEVYVTESWDMIHSSTKDNPHSLRKGTIRYMTESGQKCKKIQNTNQIEINDTKERLTPVVK